MRTRYPMPSCSLPSRYRLEDFFASDGPAPTIRLNRALRRRARAVHGELLDHPAIRRRGVDAFITLLRGVLAASPTLRLYRSGLPLDPEELRRACARIFSELDNDSHTARALREFFGDPDMGLRAAILELVATQDRPEPTTDPAPSSRAHSA
jgi:hypothetical protein